MNPLTNVKNINKLNDIEAELGVVGSKTSWHEQYRDSAYIFVGGLPFDLTEGDIICVFSQYGEIVNINLVRDKKTGKSRGYCFLAYEDQRSTTLAVDNFNGIKLLGRVLRVDHVSNYRKPKEEDNDDDITKKLREEGCAPRTPSPVLSVDEEEEDYRIPKKKVKKEHKTKSKSHEKKKKKKKHKKKDGKHSSKSRPDSSDSESSCSESNDSPPTLVQVKKEVDHHYLDQRGPNVKTERNSIGRQRQHHQSEFSQCEKERGWRRDDGRKEQRRDRETEGAQDSHRDSDRDGLSFDRHGSNREESHRGEKDTDKWRGRVSRDREERHSGRGGDRHRERDRTGDRWGNGANRQGTEQKRGTDSKSWLWEPDGEWYRETHGYADSGRHREPGGPKDQNRESRRERDRSDERSERESHRARDSHHEREVSRSGLPKRGR